MASARILLPVLGAFGAGCADRDLPTAPVGDRGAPSLLITAPERGALIGDVRTVRVTGVATDPEGDALTVTVAGIAAALDAAGAFSVEVPVRSGTSLLPVVAEDASGNRTQETRAVLAGAMAPMSDEAPDAFVLGVSAAVLGDVGDAAAAWMTHGDLAPTLAPEGPLFDVGWSGPDDCLFARGSAGAMTVGGAQIALVPKSGALRIDAVLTGISATLRTTFSAACVDGDADVVAQVGRLELRGDLEVGIEDNELVIALVSPEIEMSGLDLGIDGLPASVADLIDLDATIGPILAVAAERVLAPMVTEALGGLSEPITVDALGVPLTLEVVPVQVALSAAGAQVRLDSRVSFPGDDAAQYVFSPNALPDLAVSTGLRAGVADDALTQLLAAFWSAGGLDTSLALSVGEYGEIGTLFDEVRIHAALPPTVRADDDGRLRLTLGDLRAAFLVGEAVVTEIAVQAQVELTVTRTPGGMRLGLGASEMSLDVLSAGVAGTNALDDERFEALLAFAGTRALHALGDLVGEIPLPAVEGAGSLDLAIRGAGGYLIIDGAVRP